MGERKRVDLDLRVERNQEGKGYRVRATAEGRMEWTDFEEPFTPEELEIVRDAVSCRASRDLRQHVYRQLSPRELGRRLYERVFAGPVRDLLKDLLAGASHGVRLRLHPGSSSEWPWELLCGKEELFLALSVRTPIVRHLKHGNPLPALRTTHPLRMLVVVASPRGAETLDSERELQKIREAVDWLMRLGVVKVERLETPTLAALEEKLEGGTFHVLHFIGHGTFDRGRNQGAVLFEDEDGNRAPVNGQRLAVVLKEHSSLRLVFLNACESARGTADDLFAGVAQSLAGQGIPAVVAMQHSIADALAVTFSGRFYRALASGRAVDWAMTRARHAVHAAGEELDWAIPVLFLSSRDGILFRWLPSRGLVGSLMVVLGSLLGYLLWSSSMKPPEERPAAVYFVPAPNYCPSAEKVDMMFVRIHPGGFRMGSEDGEKDERPVHDVTISHQYCLGIHEVTQKQWKKVMGPNSVDSKVQGDRLPVTSISWNQIQDFIQRMNDMEGRKVYRLATEAEWEYAARDPHGESNCLDRQERLLPVGSLPANSLGLHDMFGNVWEMVGDWYGPYTDSPVADPRGPETGSERVKRGGGHDSAARHCRPASRNAQDPDRRSYDLGFRLAREVH